MKPCHFLWNLSIGGRERTATLSLPESLSGRFPAFRLIPSPPAIGRRRQRRPEMLLQRQGDGCDTRLLVSVAQNDGEAYAKPLNHLYPIY
jgi:hypothetical protein